MEKEHLTRVEKYSEYRKEIEQSFVDEEKEIVVQEIVNKKQARKHTVYDVYRRQKTKKVAIYITISCIVMLVLVSILILFCCLKEHL